MQVPSRSLTFLMIMRLVQARPTSQSGNSSAICFSMASIVFSRVSLKLVPKLVTRMAFLLIARDILSNF